MLIVNFQTKPNLLCRLSEWIHPLHRRGTQMGGCDNLWQVFPVNPKWVRRTVHRPLSQHKAPVWQRDTSFKATIISQPEITNVCLWKSSVTQVMVIPKVQNMPATTSQLVKTSNVFKNKKKQLWHNKCELGLVLVHLWSAELGNFASKKLPKWCKTVVKPASLTV